MNRDCIVEKIIQVYKKNGIRSFPVNCFQVLENCGYRVLSYQELLQKNRELYELCVSYTGEAYTEGVSRTVAYNDARSAGRIKFSLAHELGHIVLNHIGEHACCEREANFFASNFLAPRMAIHYSCCKNAGDVSKIFHLSLEASEYAYHDYLKWRMAALRRMTQADRAMYEYFYDEDLGKFIFHRGICLRCGKPIHNLPLSEHCASCLPKTRQPSPAQDSLSPESRLLAYIEAGESLFH